MILNGIPYILLIIFLSGLCLPAELRSRPQKEMTPDQIRSTIGTLPLSALRSQTEGVHGESTELIPSIRIPGDSGIPLPESLYESFFHSLPTVGTEDLVIGLTDPDEVMTIDQPFMLRGDLMIMNRGRLVIDDTEFVIDGDIFIMGEGKVEVSGGRFTVIQEYIYEHQAILTGDGELSFSNVLFQSSGQSWSVGMTGDSRYRLVDSEIDDGFITTALLEHSSALISGTQTPGEFLCMGTNDITFEHSDFLIFWLVLPDLSVVEAALPGDSLVAEWTFPDVDPSIRNIPYSVSIDSCTQVHWGLISRTGSNAVFSDTDFRVIGLMFDGTDSIAVHHLTNGDRYDDRSLDLPDRTLRLVSSRVQTWNFYGAGRADLSIDNCIFGEVLAMDTSTVTVSNCVCDGSGGYMGAFQHSLLIAVGSLIQSQVISRDSGVLIGALCSFQSSEIDADENSVMFLANTSVFIEPEAHASAVIFEGWMPHVEGWTESLVPIPGTADLTAGPSNDIELTGYKVEYNPDFEHPLWFSTDGFHAGSMRNDTLALWDTSGLTAGNYGLRLTLFHSYGDSIALESSARLDIPASVEEKESAMVDIFILDSNFPNPFNHSTSIPFFLPKSARIRFTLLDSRGRNLKSFFDDILPAGRHQIRFDAAELPTGIYFYRMDAGHFCRTMRMLLIR